MLPGRHRATAPGRTLDSCSQKFLPAATASITNYNASATTAATTTASAAAVASDPVFIASDAGYDDPAKISCGCCYYCCCSYRCSAVACADAESDADFADDAYADADANA